MSLFCETNICDGGGVYEPRGPPPSPILSILDEVPTGATVSNIAEELANMQVNPNSEWAVPTPSPFALPPPLVHQKGHDNLLVVLKLRHSRDTHDGRMDRRVQVAPYTRRVRQTRGSRMVWMARAASQ